jgi:hypothetical protein
MTSGVGELETAALAINRESLEAARGAIAEGCKECLRWTEIFRDRLETVKDEDIHKFARAFALIMLGFLPTKPATCPFCIQYGTDRGCLGCGYAGTHGRCDIKKSAFSIFIEAFHELGRVIYQDTGVTCFDHAAARGTLYESIDSSAKDARGLLEELPEASTFRLMRLKASYLERMVGHIPLSLLSEDVTEMCSKVKESLRNYW